MQVQATAKLHLCIRIEELLILAHLRDIKSIRMWLLEHTDTRDSDRIISILHHGRRQPSSIARWKPSTVELMVSLRNLLVKELHPETLDHEEVWCESILCVTVLLI